ncbi:hypothetical protein [uncultured Sphingomonas sp.]|uniref:hypothetical protein n=1 Tax=uncultured Sphingomonas sp. TaxID=158754 RepID=UPI003748826B
MTMQRISWEDQSIRSATSSALFLGRGIDAGADGFEHHQVERDKRDVSVSAIPRVSVILVEAELVLGRLEAVLDRPATPFDADRGFLGRARRAPRREEREFAISEVTVDQ